MDDLVEGITDPPVGIVPITDEEAVQLHRQYLEYAEIPMNPYRGFLMNAGMIAAVNTVMATNPPPVAARVYMGREADGTAVALVVGVDREGHDDFTKACKTAAAGGGPCPPHCDSAGPLPTEPQG